MFVKYTGRLSFATARRARIAFDFLCRTEGTVFYVPPQFAADSRMFGATLDGRRVTFDYDGDCGYGEYYDTIAAVADVVGIATAGKVILEAVEYEDEGPVKIRIAPADGLKKRIEKGEFG
ncbi:MAG: hypothetical protein JSS81_12850 [Acidobacteria bacterium]|nr:hypothetical protein [Acidobacteriota bacterium]